MPCRRWKDQDMKIKRWTAVVVAVLAMLAPTGAARAQLTTDALLDSLQHRSFLFFWNEANPANGLIRDRSQPGSPCSIASEGFGLSAICVAIDHGWVTRADGAARVLTSLQTFWNGPQGPDSLGKIGYKGLFYHFLDMNTAVRMASWDPELSTIDTALLLAGVLDAKQYFSSSEASDVQIRALADSINRRVDWTFVQNPSNKAIRMGWKPGIGPTRGFVGFGDWTGYNEAMIMYILALGSPTFPTDTAGWTKWTSTYNWGTTAYWNQNFVIFPPLFGHQYSHCWVDFRSIWDVYMKGKGITYFENSRRATYAQRNYAIINPLHRTAYGDSMWGLTAGDGPMGYAARGAPPTQNDDGTITPTAPVSSIAFAPEICIPVIRNLYNTYGPSIWGDYGFTDGFNPGRPWWDLDVIGIDQGPMVLMIENYRNASVWLRFMRNPEIQQGLARARFTATTLDVGPGPTVDPSEVLWSDPNPFTERVVLRYRLPEATPVKLSIYDVGGRRVAALVNGIEAGGFHDVNWETRALPGGIYYARLEWSGRSSTRKLVRVR
jgi:hypothetical protein